MAVKKKRKENGFFDDVSPHTKQAIAAIVFGVLGIFFVLSSLNIAGAAGAFMFSILEHLFGVGFVLAPLVCLLYVIVLLRPRENGYVSTPKMIGVTLLFFAILGLIALYDQENGWNGHGGYVGAAVAKPLAFLVGSITTGVVLGATTLIGLLLTLNAGLRRPGFLRKKEALKEVSPKIVGGDEELGQEDPEPLPTGEQSTEQAEVPERKTLKERVLGKQEFIVENFRGPYDPPPLSLVERDKGKGKGGDVKATANIIKRTLEQFGVPVEMDEISIGPSVTRFALKPAEGVRISKIVSLQSNLELALAAHPIRIEAPIPGKSLVGIEVPNVQKSMVGMGSLLASPEYTDSPKPLLVALGKDIAGTARFADVAKMPHLLVAGATGTGKSVTIHALINSLLFRNSPEQLRFIMIDPKRVELTAYNGIPHLLTPVIIDAKKTILSLKWAAKEMERRYEILESENVRDLTSYHEKVYRPSIKKLETKKEKGDLTDEELAEKLPEPLPYIVIIIDELADIMTVYPRELEASIVRLAQKSRAVGIHLILSTQRPEVKVITGLIKANVPSRLALRTVSQIDSRTILDQPGAENLIGAGDILFKSDAFPKPLRLQAAFISEHEVRSIVDYLKGQSAAHSLDSIDLDGAQGNNSDALFESVVDDEGDDDALYDEAKAIVLKDKKASTSYLQRRLRIGYSRAARLVDLLEERGIIGPQDGARPREILATSDESNEQAL